MISEREYIGLILLFGGWLIGTIVFIICMAKTKSMVEKMDDIYTKFYDERNKKLK
jgi:hypothetical protein